MKAHLKKFRICTGAACAVKGSVEIFEKLKMMATSNRDLKVEHCSCLGACSKGPAAEIDNKLKAPFSL